MSGTKTVIAITGPRASGKTILAMKLKTLFNIPIVQSLREVETKRSSTIILDVVDEKDLAKLKPQDIVIRLEKSNDLTPIG